jgi:hypothetical protein
VGIDLVTNNEHRYFRSRSENPWIEERNWELKIARGVLPFMENDALPIFWAAGSVPSERPTLDQLKVNTEPSSWTLRGEAIRNGTNVFVIATPEGKAGGATREYWVRTTAPYPIVYCNMRTPRGMPWQIEVTYKDVGSLALPSSVRYTEFVYPLPSIRSQRLYQFDQFEINPTIDNSIFDHSAKAGTIVSLQGQPDKYEIDNDGKVVPFREKTRLRPLLLRIGLVAAGVAIAVLVCWRYRRGRRNPIVSTTRPANN